MRSHRIINSLLYFVIQLVAKESKAKENNERITHFSVLFIDKCYISQVIHFNMKYDTGLCTWKVLAHIFNISCAHIIKNVLGILFTIFPLKLMK